MFINHCTIHMVNKLQHLQVCVEIAQGAQGFRGWSIFYS